MKKIMILTTVLLAVLAFGSIALAADMDNETTGAGKSISLMSGAQNLNFSPGVFGQYITEATSGNEQWFAIGTYHTGGTYFYATSSQQTAIWRKDRDDGLQEKFDTAAVPTTKATSDSEDQWTSGSWSKGGS